VSDPETRVELRNAEDLRLFLENRAERPQHELDAAQAFVEKVRATLPPGKNRGERDDKFGRLLPSRRTMARELVPAEKYDLPYGRMSHLAHPALASGVRFMRLVDDQGRELWRPPRNRLDEVEVLAQAAFRAALSSPAGAGAEGGRRAGVHRGAGDRRGHHDERDRRLVRATVRATRATI
jgi:hypothetical protein